MRYAPHCLKLLILLLLAPAAIGEIYRSTNDQGQTVFSDAPQPGATPVELPPTNTTPAVSPAPSSQSSLQSKNATHSNRLRIQQPSDGQVLPNGRIPTEVKLSLEQPLQKGQRIRIRVDGEVVSEGSATSTRIPLLHRGQHQISAQLLDQGGRVVSEDRISVMSYWPNN